MLFSLLEDECPSFFPRTVVQRRPTHSHLHRHDTDRRRHSQALWNQLVGEILENQLLKEEELRERELAEEKNKFKLMLDVQQFAPNEISVKVVDDFIVVEGQHEDKEDEHGWISRRFMRRYQVPKDWDVDQLSSKLSSDGVLTILAPPKEAKKEGERVIRVQHTGKPAVQEKPQQPKKMVEEGEKK